MSETRPCGHFNFNIITTFCEKSNHAVLKRQLKAFIDDFKIVMNAVKLLLTNQIYEYRIAIAAAEIQFFQN